MMTETQEYIKRATQRAAERRSGRSFQHTGMIVSTAEREALLASLPFLSSVRANLQDPATGLFTGPSGFTGGSDGYPES